MHSDIPTGFCFGIDVRAAGQKGLGVFAADPIESGQIVWRFRSGNFDVYDEAGFVALLNRMSHDQAVYELTHCFAFEDFPDVMIRILENGALINHDDDANVVTNFDVTTDVCPKPSSAAYLDDVRKALLEDRYALIAVRDIQIGEEITNNYEVDVFDPPFYLRLCESYGVDEDYLK